jgi:hypothetical protein
MPRSVSYQAELMNYLQDPQKAAAYLNAALEERDPDLIALAFSNLVQAYSTPVPDLGQPASSTSITLDFRQVLRLLTDLGLGLAVTGSITESTKAS